MRPGAVTQPAFHAVATADASKVACHAMVTHAHARHNLLGSDFGRTDFSRIFIFGPPDFFADFLAGLFLLIFVGKSAQKNPPGKSPRNPPKFVQQKSSDTLLQIGWGNNLIQRTTSRTIRTSWITLPIFRSPKRTPKPKNRTNSAKEFSEQFEGLPVITH